MTDDPYSFANWNPSLWPHPEQATEVNQMYTQTQLPGHTYDGSQDATGGMLGGAPYGQAFENQNLHQPGAPTPTQGFLAPTYPTHAHPSSTHSTQSFLPLPASGGHQSYAPFDALNHTGNFGASNVGASNLHQGHAGHFLPPTSTQFNGHDVIANPAPLQTSSHALMPPLPTPTPPMTAGTSRSSSYTPETPGSVDDWVPPTAEDLTMLMIWIMVPQLTSEQRKYFWLRFNAGNPQMPWEVGAMIATNKANEASSSAHHAGLAPPMQPIPAYGPSINGASRSHANGTPGAQRTPKAREHRHDPRSVTTTTTTTYQAAALSADLESNDNKSTGATIMGGAHSSGAGGVASSHSSSADAAADPSTPPEISTPSDSPRYKTEWDGPKKLTADKHAALDIMYRDMLNAKQFSKEERKLRNRRCIVPLCDQHFCAAKQKRDLHVSRAHLEAEQTFVCEEPGCSSVVVGEDSHMRHLNDKHPEKAAEVKRAAKAKRAAKTKMAAKAKRTSKAKKAVEEEEEESEGAGPSEMPRKDDDDDAGFGDIGGMFTPGSYGWVQA